MPQFDIRNANLSADGLQAIKDRIGFVPFVYDTGYPVLGVYVDNDPVPSGSTIFAESVGGRVPFDPDFHDGVRGNLVVGYGHTYNNEGSIHRGSESLFWDFYGHYSNDTFRINNVDYSFPIQRGDTYATSDSGGNWVDGNGDVQTSGIRIAYTGNDSSNSNMRFSESLASTLLAEDVVGYVNKVIAIFDDEDDDGNLLYADCFPYDTDLAQQHFDMMVLVCYQIGKEAFDASYFVYQYKQVDGTAVTSEADLDAYNNAGYALMFLGSKPSPADYPSGVDPNNLKVVYNPIVVNGVKVTWKSKLLWDDAMVKARQGDIEELLEPNNDLQWYYDAQLAQWVNAPLDPRKNSQWYQGEPIPEDFFMARPNAPAWVDIVYSTLPTGIVANTILELLEQGREDEIPLYYTGDASIYDTDPGNANYWEEDPFYQKYYSALWQLNNRWYEGNQTYLAIRPSSTNGAAIVAQGDGAVPPFILGLDNGEGELQVWITSNYAESNIDPITRVDDTIYDIAEGIKLGDRANGQWVHRAITRKGNTWKTWENGVKVSEWNSETTVKRVTRDAKTGGTDSKASLHLSIGRGQQADYFKGYIDGLKFTKGESLYDADFDVPTSAPTIDQTANLYKGNHNLESAFSAIKKVMSQLETEYRINTNGTLDAGLPENVFVGHGTDTPTAIIVRDSQGEDPGITGLNPDALTTQFEAEDWVAGVEYIENAGSDGENIDLYERFLTEVPYYDLFGNPLERVAYVAETEVSSNMAPKRAEAFLEEFTRIKKSLSLSLEYYDVKGDFEVGDNIFVYDPEIGFVDTPTKAVADGRSEPYEQIWQGQFINPEKIRIVGITYPIEETFGVYLRKVVSASPFVVRYYDLNDYIEFEAGNTQLEVGEIGKQIGDDLRFSSQISGAATGDKMYKPNKVIDPDDPANEGIRLTTGFETDALGTQRSIIFLEWLVPRNSDETLITNGLQYEITVQPVNPVLGGTEHYFINWGNTTFTIQDLLQATDYKVGVQAITTGASSGFVYETITTAVDTGTPPTPDEATTLASLQGAIQVIHRLGAATDAQGNPLATVVDFTLPSDLSHLNVYGSTTSGFTVGESSLIGKVPADASMLRLGIPAVTTLKGDSLDSADTMFFRFTAVDLAGNESDASPEQQKSANLVLTENIDDAAITTAKIRNLSVDTAKIANAAITNAKIGNLIESDNYSLGTSGWTIRKQDTGYPNGYAEFNDAVFRGNITATSGDIGGWTIASDKLSADDGNSNSMEIDGANAYIQANYTAGSAGFKLNADGSVEFNDGTFRGDLSAGTISIGSGNAVFNVDSNGNMWLGHANYGDAPFTVSNSGVLFASGATITGTMTINAGSVHIG